MSSADRQNEIIQLLIDHEETIGQLYDYFAQRFANQREFWAVLAAEERLHSQWIKNLKDLLASGHVVFNPDRFDKGAIAASLTEIRQQIARIKQTEQFSVQDALHVAVELELRHLESKFYEIYDSDKEELKGLLMSLQQAFQEHRQRLLDQYKSVDSL